MIHFFQYLIMSINSRWDLKKSGSKDNYGKTYTCQCENSGEKENGTAKRLRDSEFAYGHPDKIHGEVTMHTGEINGLRL